MKIEISTNEIWLAKRMQDWGEYESTFQRDLKDKLIDADILRARKQWYFEGDLTPLVRLSSQRGISHTELSIQHIIELCPLSSVDFFCDFLKEFCLYQSKNQQGWWGANQSDRNRAAINSFTAIFLGKEPSGADGVYRFFLEKLLPNEGVVRFPFPLGKDGWAPELIVNIPNLVRRYLNLLYAYLYGRKDFSSYSHAVAVLPFVRENLSLVDKKGFALSSIRRPCYAKSGEYLNLGGQQNWRVLIAAMNGYDLLQGGDGKVRCNDVAVESELKDIFNSTKMPKAYHTLVEYIKEHKEKSFEAGY